MSWWRSSNNNNKLQCLPPWWKAGHITEFVGVTIAVLVGCAALLAALYPSNNNNNNHNPAQQQQQQQAAWIRTRDILLDQLSSFDPLLPVKFNQLASTEYRALSHMVLKEKGYNEPLVPNNDNFYPIVQRFAMVCSYMSFGWPVSALHECEWNTTTCRTDNNTVIVGLQFLANVRTFSLSTLPPALGYLSHLQELRAVNHDLVGALPPNRWNDLEYLDLSNNRLTSVFGGSNSNVHWPKLKHINLDNNALNEVVSSSAIQGLVNVQYFSVQGNWNLQGPLLEYAWPSWRAIQQINLDGTGVTGQLMADDPNLPAYASLTRFSAVHAPLLGTLPNALSSAQNLQVFAMGFTHTISYGTLPDSWSSLSQLQVLSLVNMGLEGTLPDSWHSLSSLSELDLYNNPQITGTIPSSWGATMRSLRSLRLSATSLRGTIPSTLGQLFTLRSLRLAETQLSGTMPAEICALRQEGRHENLQQLTVDCSKVVCPCCAYCQRQL